MLKIENTEVLGWEHAIRTVGQRVIAAHVCPLRRWKKDGLKSARTTSI